VKSVNQEKKMVAGKSEKQQVIAFIDSRTAVT
jgi:hypothetical protein